MVSGAYWSFWRFGAILVILVVVACGCSLVTLVIPRVFLRFGWYFGRLNGFGGILVILVVSKGILIVF
jgi:hypothetical protein